MSKLILVLGATGAQGRHVINSLLASSEDGTPSPYAIRALTRDPQSKYALALRERGVEVVKAAALDGAYGAWVNIDGFTVGEQREIYAGMRIFELAKQTKSLRHYVWSSLSYCLKMGGYNQKYRCEHFDAKGRVAEWLEQQASVYLLGPVQREDGTFVFSSPIGDGHMPLIALEDLGFFARYTFDHRSETSAKNTEIASEMVGWDHLVATFKKVTGKKAEYNRESIEEWFSKIENADKPVAAQGGPGSTTWGENFTGWWNSFRDDLHKRDMDRIRKINPNGYTLEKWMIENKYDGVLGKTGVLKIVEDGVSQRNRKE
ncbi:NAD-P-binding protein [Russula aff. rugulosa BPL654]|nr:NAD-P-binding protein [Russula aff. rugulosa BPL654]